MTVEKAAAVAWHPYKSAKWDEIIAGCELDPCQVPLLEMLCSRYAVVDQCQEDMDAMGGQLVYENPLEVMKPLPQLGIMKQASAEIRQLNKQLGIRDEAASERRRDGGREGPLPPELRLPHRSGLRPRCTLRGVERAEK